MKTRRKKDAEPSVYYIHVDLETMTTDWEFRYRVLHQVKIWKWWVTYRITHEKKEES